jgi:uroporphyrinogen decarboxylase
MKFEPNYQNLVDAATNQKPERFPLYEHGISFVKMDEILGQSFAHLFDSRDKADLKTFFRYHNLFYRQMGYDTVTWELGITSILPGAGALGAHQPGSIKNREDFEKYPWDSLEQMYFSRWSDHFEALRAEMPDGMKAVGGVGNGVFECVQDVVGYENLCLLLADDPALYMELFEKMGEVSLRIWTRFMAEFGDMFCVLRFGDDLGYKSSTMLPPAHIIDYILPQYRKIVDLVHAHHKPFLLHCCGCIFDVMEDIIKYVKIDAKHSNEDVIAPFPVWLERYGHRIGLFGGIDMDVLCQMDPDGIRTYTLTVLDQACKYRGVAFGSGNSIPDYVPTEGYLAMVKAIREFRGEGR